MTVILANGEFPSHPVPLHALASATQLYCCDGAIKKLSAYLQEGHIIAASTIYVVGDGDSEGFDSIALPQGYHVVYHHESEQDYNDLTKTMRLATSHSVEDIVLIGATGLREDHTLGNISLLSYYLAERFPLRSLVMLTNYGRFTPILTTTTFDSHPSQQVSIFSLSPEARITLHRLRYPWHHKPIRQWWQCTLNEAIANAFTVEIEGEGEVIVYQTY